MVKLIGGDLFTTEAEVIVHQVNCRGVMGSGVAKQVKEKYRQAYEDYVYKCKNFQIKDYFGTTQLVHSNGKIIANLFGEVDYGKDGARYTNYEAFYTALEDLYKKTNKDTTYAFPYKIGCALGGADWDIIYIMIQKVFHDRMVLIYKLEV